MLMDKYTIADITSLNPSKEIQFKKLPKPGCLIEEPTAYRFDELEKYNQIMSGSASYSELLDGKVAEAKIAAEAARKIHLGKVTDNMLGKVTDKQLEDSREKAETLQKVYDEKEYARIEALAAYTLQLDKKTVAAKFAQEAVPFFTSVMTEKEVKMAKARDAYVAAIKDYFLEAQKITPCRMEVDALRRSYTVTKTGSDQVPPFERITFVERSLIDRGYVTHDFPFQLSSDEMELIGRAKRELV